MMVLPRPWVKEFRHSGIISAKTRYTYRYGITARVTSYICKGGRKLMTWVRPERRDVLRPGDIGDERR